MTEEIIVPKHRRIETPTRLEKILISKINPGSRIRKWETETEGERKQLMESIEERGLLHPIAVMEYEEPYEGYSYFLLAGARRLGAMKEMGQKEIDAKIFPSGLSADEILAIELIENRDRKNFTPEEEALAIKKFHEACIRLYGQRGAGQRASDEGHSTAETARMLGISKSKVIEAINAAQLFEAIPELGKHVKKWTDIRRLSREADRQVKIQERQEEIKKVREEKVDDPAVRIKGIIASWYIISDAAEGMRDLGAQTVDLVEFDPHYPIRDDDRNNILVSFQVDRKKESYHFVSREEFPNHFLSVAKEAYRILRPEGWFIVWFGYEYFPLVIKLLIEAGFLKGKEFDPYRLVHFTHAKWVKKGFGHTSNPRDTLGHTVEPFIYVKKSKSARLNEPHEDVFLHSPTHANKKINPFEKPILLYEEILKTFVPEQSMIVSAATGSGNILLAAANHNCIAKGFDLSEDYQKEYIIRAHSSIPPNYGREQYES